MFTKADLFVRDATHLLVRTGSCICCKTLHIAPCCIAFPETGCRAILIRLPTFGKTIEIECDSHQGPIRFTMKALSLKWVLLNHTFRDWGLNLLTTPSLSHFMVHCVCTCIHVTVRSISISFVLIYVRTTVHINRVNQGM